MHKKEGSAIAKVEDGFQDLRAFLDRRLSYQRFYALHVGWVRPTLLHLGITFPHTFGAAYMGYITSRSWPSSRRYSHSLLGLGPTLEIAQAPNHPRRSLISSAQLVLFRPSAEIA